MFIASRLLTNDAMIYDGFTGCSTQNRHLANFGVQIEQNPVCHVNWNLSDGTLFPPLKFQKSWHKIQGAIGLDVANELLRHLKYVEQLYSFLDKVFA